MEPSPENVTLVETPANDRLFEEQTWGWNGIDSRAIELQNQSEPFFKTFWIPQSISYIDIFIHCLPIKLLIIVLLPSISRAMKEADITMLINGDLLLYLGLCILMYT